MRWKLPPVPVEGDIRIEKRFLFFPITIGDEIRWLENAYVLLEYVAYGDRSSLFYNHYWQIKSFVHECTVREPAKDGQLAVHPDAFNSKCVHCKRIIDEDDLMASQYKYF